MKFCGILSPDIVFQTQNPKFCDPISHNIIVFIKPSMSKGHMAEIMILYVGSSETTRLRIHN